MTQGTDPEIETAVTPWVISDGFGRWEHRANLYRLRWNSHTP